jgi:glucose-1-phosphate adenylyltransferase
MNTLAMILAGGRGKRMGVLCQERPKPALPFGGRFRVIDFTLSNCIHSGIDNIAALTDYQRSHMADYLQKWRTSNAGLRSLDVLEPRTGYYKGTADAAYQNLDYLNNQEANTVVILAGDHIYKMHYGDMLAFHNRMNADVTVGVVQVPIDQAHRFGTVNVSPQGRIEDFSEKSPTPISNLASMGIYIFDKEILTQRLIEDAGRPDSSHDFGYAILPQVVSRDRVFAYKFDGYWQDIGTKEAYYMTNLDIVRPNPSLSLNGNWPVLTTQRGFPALITQPGRIENSIVTPGCVIKGQGINSILSPGVCVEEKALVKDSILMENVSVGYHSVIEHCIIDEEVQIDKLCYIGFGESLIRGDWDVTVIGKGAMIPPCTAIGWNCTIQPHVLPDDFSTNTVSAGSIISPGSDSLLKVR